MKLRISKQFLQKLDRQVDYIALDKPQAAEKFRLDLILEIEKIPVNPLSFKKFTFFNDDNII